MKIPCVRNNDQSGIYKIVEYLIQQGHRRIAFLSYNLNSENDRDRFYGYLNALNNYGITPKESYIIDLMRNHQANTMLEENDELSSELVRNELRTLLHEPSPPPA